MKDKNILNVNRSIVYSEKLIKKLEKLIKNQKSIDEKTYNEIINFCVISCKDCKNFYRKIDIDFSTLKQPILIKSKNYSTDKMDKMIIQEDQIFNFMRSLDKTLKRILDYLKLKKNLESD